jgi:DNA-binding NarL/FixJ family response regulator
MSKLSTRPTSSPIRLLLVDDHPILRTGLVNLVQRQRDLLVVGQAGSGEEALRLLATCQPDICLLDLSLPGIDGFETLRRLQKAAPMLRVIVLTSSDSAAVAERALRGGASGFISKNIDHDAIVLTIRDVHAGHLGIQRGVAPATAARSSHPLTPREMDVLSLLRQGLTNGEIAHELRISERTVKGHVTFIIEKLDATDRTGAVARAFDLGLLKAGSAG